MLALYYADVSILDPEILPEPMSEYRVEMLSRTKSALVKKQGAGAELLLYRALRDYMPDISIPPRIIRTGQGKPVLQDGGLHFSLSHSGSLAACAVSDAELGLDIQFCRSFNAALCSRYMSEGERGYIDTSEDKSFAFTRIWTLKESFLKADGTGLRGISGCPQLIPGQDCPGGYSFWQAFIDGCCFSICARMKGPASPDKIKKIKLA